MYTAPDTSNPEEALAHVFSEIHNDNAPIGWESYKALARYTLKNYEEKSNATNRNQQCE